MKFIDLRRLLKLIRFTNLLLKVTVVKKMRMFHQPSFLKARLGAPGMQLLRVFTLAGEGFFGDSVV